MTLIEASAGTGKTRELTGIVATLVGRAGRRLDEILVVTFTRAATAELRDRIRGTLRSAHRAVVSGEAPEGSQAEELVAGWRGDAAFDPATAARRLEAALQDIDRASVYTIHGFCQRVLSELAFDGGFPFGFEVSGDDTEIVSEAARDFWRRRIYPASKTLAGYAMENQFRPEDLVDWIRKWRAKPALRIAGGEPPAIPLEVREAKWQGVLKEVRADWERHREAFEEEVLCGGWLNRSKYRKPRTSSELAALTAWWAEPEALLLPNGWFARYGAKELAAACKRGHELPDNPLFDAFDRLEETAAELRSGYDAWLRWARRESLAEVRDSIRRRILEDRRLGYDDLLLELHRELRSRDGERLAERIRRNYPCALIDEFQDTDPVQAQVFMRIYGKAVRAPERAFEEGVEAGTPDSEPDAGRDGSGGLCVVGDPKQSIYRFRGADVFAYLRARDAAPAHRSLTRNWRSVPALVEAVNAVFAGSEPFVLPEIEYPLVEPGRQPGNPLRIEEAPRSGPLQFWLLPAGRDGKRWTKGETGRFAAETVAEEIARILALAAGGRATIDEELPSGGEARRLTGADLAVLVRTRAQGRLVADALRKRNVASVEVGDANVFDSREAEQMERLLWALVEPGREARVRGALAGDLFGLDVRGLHDLEAGEETWAVWLERLRGWRSRWDADGIGSLLRRLVEAEGGAARLLGYRDGARRLTNVRHLTELLQGAEAEQGMASAALAVWFSRRRAAVRVRDEGTELRIESDEQLVRILTVHNAKGLEFPVVFLPFAWDARDPKGGKPDHAVYHEGASEGYPEVLDLEPDEGAQAAARREELSEELRLFYVALTRAKYRCVVIWGQVNAAEHAPLAWLLHREDGAPKSASPPSGARNEETATTRDTFGPGLDAARAHFRGLAAADLHEELRAFAAPRCDSVTVTVLDFEERAHRTILDPPPPTVLAARRLGRPLRRTRQVTSFSALSAAAGPVSVGAADLDRPDHDQHETAESLEPPRHPAAEEDDRTAFTFPRGAAAGSCLHRIFEKLDEHPGAESGVDGICREALAEFGFAGEWHDVARTMVERARAVRLAPSGRGAEASPRQSSNPSGTDGFRLADPLPRLVELEFAFPVEGLDRDRLGATLQEGGYPNPFPQPVDGRSGEPPSPPIDGFLRGFVDLVVEHRGRWYVVDYKSNWLGPRPEDYSREAVAAAMRASVYPLQYLLYLVALHRYVDFRLPEYDYERHVGGVFYLFVRGLDPAAGMARGVYFDRPAGSFVEKLDRLLRGGRR